MYVISCFSLSHPSININKLSLFKFLRDCGSLTRYLKYEPISLTLRNVRLITFRVKRNTINVRIGLVTKQLNSANITKSVPKNPRLKRYSISNFWK